MPAKDKSEKKILRGKVDNFISPYPQVQDMRRKFAFLYREGREKKFS